MICSLDPRSRRSTSPGAPWTSVCMGDSGGPLVAGGKLVGVTSWSEWCGVRHDPSVFARVSALREFALGNPVWAPVAVGLPTVTAGDGGLRCAAPAFEGPAEVTGAIWSEIRASGDASIVRSAPGLTFSDARRGVHYTCAVRARNDGGATRTPPSVPVTTK
jgi:secreted trypsin-like serine protease